MQRLMRASLLAPALLASLFFAAGSASGVGIEPSHFFRITALHSGRCLDVTGGPDATGNGVGVIQWDCHGGDNQKWQLVPLGDNYFKILAKHSGKALSVYGGTISTGDGVAVQQWDYNGADNQIWKVVPDRGSFLIIAKHSGKVLEIKGGPAATWNGAPAQQWADVGGANQRWTLTQLPDVGDAGLDHVTGTFTYSDTEVGNPETFPRPIAGCRVEVWRAGARAATGETDVDGKFDAPVPHVTDGTDTTVVLFATNRAAQVLAGVGPFSVRSTRHTGGGGPLDFSARFDDAEQVRSFNAAHDIRLAYNYASARRAPGETEVIPTVDVTFMDDAATALLTRYNQPAGGLLIHRSLAASDLVVMHEYAHFLEDKIGSFLVLPSIHDTCFTTQRCLTASACPNLLINSPENAWMEGFADYFAMAVKRANPSERFNLESHGATMDEAQLDRPAACGAVGRTAMDGRLINGEMIESFVASALWHISGSGGDPARSEEAVFQIFDSELDGSATGVLPNIRLFHDAWVNRLPSHPGLLGHAGLDNILGVNIPTVATHRP